MSEEPVVEHFLFRGKSRVDHFGRIMIDTCPSDNEHLRSSITNPETGKPSCRFLLDDEVIRRLPSLISGEDFEQVVVTVTLIKRSST